MDKSEPTADNFSMERTYITLVGIIIGFSWINFIMLYGRGVKNAELEDKNKGSQA